MSETPKAYLVNTIFVRTAGDDLRNHVVSLDLALAKKWMRDDFASVLADVPVRETTLSAGALREQQYENDYPCKEILVSADGRYAVYGRLHWVIREYELLQDAPIEVSG